MSEILETFKGCVDDVRDGIAYLTIRCEETGELFYGEHDAEKLQNLGISWQHRNFECKTIRQADDTVIVDIVPLPDTVISPERLRELEAKIDHALAGYTDEDDY